jgi:hypothetical protein
MNSPDRTLEVRHYRNPYTPGAGHPPPYLAGRDKEQSDFSTLLKQTTILENVVLTGLRGVGKTVLLERFKAIAIDEGWLWAGNDLSETASITEVNLAIRLMTDLSLAASGVSISVPAMGVPVGFRVSQPTFETITLSFEGLLDVYNGTPGLVSDKIKAVLIHAWSFLSTSSQRLIFAYDEAQNLSDHADESQFPLSVLLDVFQSIQKQGIPFMLVLTGLPTLFPKLVEARTYAERMFHIMTLGRLSDAACRQAITVPIDEAIKAGELDFGLSDSSVEMVIAESAGYPYFIQFICKEVFDVFLQSRARGGNLPEEVPFNVIQRKLDADFFSGRWAKVTDRQRELLWIVSVLPTCDEEFTIQEVVQESKKHPPIKACKSSAVNQIFVTLAQQGMVYKNRFGKYSFAVPLMGSFIRRTYRPNEPALPFAPRANALLD